MFILGCRRSIGQSDPHSHVQMVVMPCSAVDNVDYLGSDPVMPLMVACYEPRRGRTKY
jgi:hypothetical protein